MKCQQVIDNLTEIGRQIRRLSRAKTEPYTSAQLHALEEAANECALWLDDLKEKAEEGNLFPTAVLAIERQIAAHESTQEDFWPSDGNPAPHVCPECGSTNCFTKDGTDE